VSAGNERSAALPTAQPPPPSTRFDDQAGNVSNPGLVRAHPHRRRSDQLTVRCRFTETQREDVGISELGGDLRARGGASRSGGQRIGSTAERSSSRTWTGPLMGGLAPGAAVLSAPRRIRTQLGPRRTLLTRALPSLYRHSTLPSGNVVGQQPMIVSLHRIPSPNNFAARATTEPSGSSKMQPSVWTARALVLNSGRHVCPGPVVLTLAADSGGEEPGQLATGPAGATVARAGQAATDRVAAA